MNKEKILYSIICVLSIVLLFSVLKNYGNYVDQSIAVLEDDEPIAFKSLETPVEIQVLKKQDLIQTITSNGVVKAQKRLDIIPQVSGIIKRLYYTEGDFVKKNDIILTIDDELYQIELQRTQDQLDVALGEYGISLLKGNETWDYNGELDTLKYDKIKIDHKNQNDVEALNILKKNQHKKMRAIKSGLTMARLNKQKAEINLRNTVIRAPFNGYIAELDLFQNDRVQAGKKAMKIVSLDKLFVEVAILETEINFIKKRVNAEIKIPAFPGEKFIGFVKTISPILDSESGTCRVQLEVENPNKKIKPGMFANVSITSKIYKNKLLVPRDSILPRDDRKVCFVYQQGKAKWKYVDTGLENENFIEILNDKLSEGDSLIVSGHFNLAHDALVVIVDKN